MVNRNRILLLFCLTLLFCGCGGEKYMEHNDYTVVFDVRKDSIFIDGILYPDLYRELDANPQDETNPLYDIAIRHTEEKTRKLKEQGKCEKTYNTGMSKGNWEINMETDWTPIRSLCCLSVMHPPAKNHLPTKNHTIKERKPFSLLLRETEVVTFSQRTLTMILIL